MDRKPTAIILLVLCALLALISAGRAEGTRLLPLEKHRSAHPDTIVHRKAVCLSHMMGPAMTAGKPGLPLKRKHPWSLPEQALSADYDTTINVLVLRYNFQFEDSDNPKSNGRGHMDFSNPIVDSVTEVQYLEENGFIVDPPPHDSAYFDAHMEALHNYYHTVSEGRISITWDIWPRGDTATYQLPEPMSYYGACTEELPPEVFFDSIIAGLERYFVDCVTTADTESPEIDFSQYGAMFLFHAGTDAQNDIAGNSCNDLFSGYIRFFQEVPVDGGANAVQSALILPEALSQDGRAVAMNGLIAHEFCHQLGGVDMYNTANFFTVLGDFCLMDHNGGNVGLEFPDYESGVFNAFPVYPSAWHRAYLGFTEVEEVRSGTDIRLVAAELDSSSSAKIIKVPISEYQYYLIENRIIETDGQQTFMLQDPDTYVFRGPGRANRELSGEYDFLLPGSGALIYLVDEEVAIQDVDGDGLQNFQDNSLQWIPQRKFVTLVEADGVQDLSGYCFAGCGYTYQYYGWENDMWREDRNANLTPFTNPPTVDNRGNQTHVWIENIRRDTADGVTKVPMDSVILFDVAINNAVDGFPVRVGMQAHDSLDYHVRSPIVYDLDGDDSPEILAAAGSRILAFTADGEDFIDCPTCPAHFDSVGLLYDPDSQEPIPSPNISVYEVPAFADGSTVGLGEITAGPVIGTYTLETEPSVVAAFRAADSSCRLVVYGTNDANDDGLADERTFSSLTYGLVQDLCFGADRLWVLTDLGAVYEQLTATPFLDSLGGFGQKIIGGGLCAVGDDAVVALRGTGVGFFASYFSEAVAGSTELPRVFDLGPVCADLNRDSLPEIIAFSSDGHMMYQTIDTTGGSLSFLDPETVDLGDSLTTDPVVSDIDLDGYPDVIIGGLNKLYAFDRNMISLSGYPLTVDDRFAVNAMVGPPIVADIQTGGRPETVFPTAGGNIHAFDLERAFGFPLPVGGIGIGSPVVFSDGGEGRLGYVGFDGWFQLWRMADDTGMQARWPMASRDAAASDCFDAAGLGEPSASGELLPESMAYNYPNPVTGGTTTIRYVLGRDATSVSLNIFDLSGKEVRRLPGTRSQGTNEVDWSCADVTPGVYRCVIEVDFGGSTEHTFTDIAIIN